MRFKRHWTGKPQNWCTGWMVGPSSFVTAAHCLYNADNGAPDPWAHGVTAYPGYNSDSMDPNPFGSCYFLQYFVTNFWIQNQNTEHDYGIVRLRCTIGYESGTLGFTTYTGDGIGEPVMVVGYPSDLSDGGTEMWYGGGSITGSTSSITYYNADTYGGESGAPVISTNSARCIPNCAIAGHSASIPPENGGPRIGNYFLSWLINERSYVTTELFIPIVFRRR